MSETLVFETFRNYTFDESYQMSSIKNKLISDDFDDHILKRYPSSVSTWGRRCNVSWFNFFTISAAKVSAEMYYRLQKFANTFLCESSRQVGSTSRRPLGDAVAGGWSWTDQSRTRTPSAANLKATPAERGVRELVQAIVP